MTEAPSNAPEEYRYFESPFNRFDLIEFTRRLTDYLAKEKIANIIFIDRAARPAWTGVNEYWDIHFKKLRKPGLFFANPEGFKKKVAKRSPSKRFNDRFTRLQEDKSKPLVLFDTCSHGGETITRMLKVIEKAGFSDVRVVTANPPDNDKVEPAIHIHPHPGFVITCYPFGLGKHSLVRKGTLVVSEPERRKRKRDELEKGYQLRQEIKRIIREAERKIPPPRKSAKSR